VRMGVDREIGRTESTILPSTKCEDRAWAFMIFRTFSRISETEFQEVALSVSLDIMKLILCECGLAITVSLTLNREFNLQGRAPLVIVYGNGVVNYKIEIS